MAGMNSKSIRSRIRRILVALDASTQDQNALEVAVHLAAGLRAELQGLFLQDVSLLRFAQLPVATEVVSRSADERRMDSNLLRKELEAQAIKLRADLARLAQPYNIRCTFDTARGHLESEVLAAFESADLLVVNRRTGHMLVNREQLGSTASLVVAKSRRTVLLLEEHAQLDRQLFVLFETLKTGIKTLATSVRVFQGEHRQLVVLLSATTGKDFERRKAAAETWLNQQGVSADYRWLRRTDTHTLSHALWQHGGGVLVVAADTPFLQRVSLAVLMRELRLPVVLVR